jgi:hypothetical protein
MPWTEQPVFFIDFEGGIRLGRARVRHRDAPGRPGDRAHPPLRPDGPHPGEDTEIHGLREEALARCEPFSADWELFAGLRERGPLAAHYAGAENALLKATWPYPRASPDFAQARQPRHRLGPLDRLGAHLLPALPGDRVGPPRVLVAACALQAELDVLAAVHCPPGSARYHAALYDALAGALLLGSLSRIPQLASLTVMQLIALSTLDAKKRGLDRAAGALLAPVDRRNSATGSMPGWRRPSFCRATRAKKPGPGRGSGRRAGPAPGPAGRAIQGRRPASRRAPSPAPRPKARRPRRPPTSGALIRGRIAWTHASWRGQPRPQNTTRAPLWRSRARPAGASASVARRKREARVPAMRSPGCAARRASERPLRTSSAVAPNRKTGMPSGAAAAHTLLIRKGPVDPLAQGRRHAAHLRAQRTGWPSGAARSSELSRAL